MAASACEVLGDYVLTAGTKAGDDIAGHQPEQCHMILRSRFGFGLVKHAGIWKKLLPDPGRLPRTRYDTTAPVDQVTVAVDSGVGMDHTTTSEM